MNLFNLLSRFDGYPVQISFFSYDRRDHSHESPFLRNIYTIELIFDDGKNVIQERFLLIKNITQDEKAVDFYLDDLSKRFLKRIQSETK